MVAEGRGRIRRLAIDDVRDVAVEASNTLFGFSLRQ